MGAVESAAERGFALREPMVMISTTASFSWAAGCSTVAAKANKAKHAANFSVAAPLLKPGRSFGDPFKKRAKIAFALAQAVCKRITVSRRGTRCLRDGYQR